MALAGDVAELQRRRIRRAALLWFAVAVAFYAGFIVLILVRASR